MAEPCTHASSTVVAVRLRPPSARESGARCIAPADERALAFTNPDRSVAGFAFDRVYGEEVSQAAVFEDCRPIVASVLRGNNGTILAYGQTGSGKTHTLIGSVDDAGLRGLVPRAVAALGEGIAADTSGAEFSVRLSVVETYCERIRDLLDPAADNLQVKQDSGGAMFVDGALEAQVGSEEQLVAVMRRGLAARTVAATGMNEQSSRSHCVVTVTVEKVRPDGSLLVGKLKMLTPAAPAARAPGGAASERQDKTHAAGQTLVEGSQINKSLSALANVIYALTDAPGGDGEPGAPSGAVPKHVPYRDSKLTRILQDSLGGSSRTMLIICCSPCAENGPETLSSLRCAAPRGVCATAPPPAAGLRGPPAEMRTARAHARVQLWLPRARHEEPRDAQRAAQRRGARRAAGGGAGQGTARRARGLRRPGAPPRGQLRPPLSLRRRAAALRPWWQIKALEQQLADGRAAAALAAAAPPEPRGTPPAPPLPGCGGGGCGGGCGARVLPWWQHAVLAGVSVLSMAAYMGWEARWLATQAVVA
ncbi:kin [Scenedesmus sp. PABB004]|nr:kin [Scenedesmus sp. PABB004]